MARKIKVHVSIEGIYKNYIPCLRSQSIRMINYCHQTFWVEKKIIEDLFTDSSSHDYWWVGENEDELVVQLYAKAWEISPEDFYLTVNSEGLFEMQFYNFDTIWEKSYLRSQIYDIDHLVYEALLSGAPEDIIFWSDAREEYFGKRLGLYSILLKQ